MQCKTRLRFWKRSHQSNHVRGADLLLGQLLLVLCLLLQEFFHLFNLVELGGLLELRENNEKLLRLNAMSKTHVFARTVEHAQVVIGFLQLGRGDKTKHVGAHKLALGEGVGRAALFQTQIHR